MPTDKNLSVLPKESNSLSIISESVFLGKKLMIYGDMENPLFLAKDVAEWIGYDSSSVNKMVFNVDEDEKVRKIFPTLGGEQIAWFLTENGLYEVLMQSCKPIAKQFKKEVKTILQEIRKHGGYLTPQKVEEALLNPDVLIKLATELKEERAKRLEAERTKAQIGSHREATAMSTAAAAVKKLKKLENEIGTGKTWKRVTCIPWLKKYFYSDVTSCSMIGKYLVKMSTKMKKEVKKVPDERFNYVCAFHVDVIEKFHEMVKADIWCTILTKYRKITA